MVQGSEEVFNNLKAKIVLVVEFVSYSYLESTVSSKSFMGHIHALQSRLTC